MNVTIRYHIEDSNTSIIIYDVKAVQSIIKESLSIIEYLDFYVFSLEQRYLIYIYTAYYTTKKYRKSAAKAPGNF